MKNLTTNKRFVKGFTLIELIIVIVILGILSVTAAPKFINLSGDANAATVDKLKQDLATLNKLVEAKTIIDGLYSKTFPGAGEPYTINGDTFTLFNKGTISNKWAGSFEQLLIGDFEYLGNAHYFNDRVCDFSGYCVIDLMNLTHVMAGRPGTGIFFMPNGYALNDDCYAYYSFVHNYGQRTVDSKEIGAVTTGC